jgi:hypothetical protein
MFGAVLGWTVTLALLSVFLLAPKLPLQVAGRFGRHNRHRR